MFGTWGRDLQAKGLTQWEYRYTKVHAWLLGAQRKDVTLWGPQEGGTEEVTLKNE